MTGLGHGLGRWRTSTYSSDSGTNCVEAVLDPDARVGMRDSRNRTGARLDVPASAWTAFLRGARTGL